jgi:quercetin dioxygenase-like cupin family protein
MLKVTIAPHTALPWHTHTFPNAGYVLSGILTVQDKNGKSQVVRAGEAFAESINSVHRGIAGDTPTVVLLTYAGVTGAATSNPVQGGMQEY